MYESRGLGGAAARANRTRRLTSGSDFPSQEYYRNIVKFQNLSNGDQPGEIVMLRAVATIVFGTLLFVSSFAAAAELTGFWPIEFGMSKEEAIAALKAEGLTGEWEEESILYYDITVDRGTLELRAGYIFEEGGAAEALVSHHAFKYSEVFCRDRWLIISTLIRQKHDISPLIVYGDKEFEQDGNGFRMNEVMMFSFEKSAYIKVNYNFRDRPKRESTCSIDLFYRPPSKNQNPF